MLEFMLGFMFGVHAGLAVQYAVEGKGFATTVNTLLAVVWGTALLDVLNFI